MEQNNRLQELKREEREEERKVLRYLTGIVQNELPFIRSAWDLLVRLDVELAKCGLAALFDGACATISPDGEDAPLSLLGARHPLLALDPQIRKQGGPHPVDLIFRPTDRALVISGGNAGGKTVCLKTLGLLAIMTLAGLPVPAAKGSVIPWWTSIHAFIGDEQSLDDHLSTFTAQIRHLGNAWEATDRRTLILLDEFGAGTDPAQGAALAQAVLDGLLERGAHVVAATHFPALKTYALTREGVRAASVLFDPGTKKPLFRLAYDQVGASQALDVAREHGLPESVLRRAEQYLLLDGQDMTAVMDRLNALAAKREGELDALKAEQQRTREKRKAVQERFERERERLIKDVRELSAKVMKDWQEGKAGHKQALKELAKVRAELHVSPEQEEAAAPAFDIAQAGPACDAPSLEQESRGARSRRQAEPGQAGHERRDLVGRCRVARPSRCAAAAGQAEVRRAGADDRRKRSRNVAPSAGSARQAGGSGSRRTVAVPRPGAAVRARGCGNRSRSRYGGPSQGSARVLEDLPRYSLVRAGP